MTHEDTKVELANPDSQAVLEDHEMYVQRDHVLDWMNVYCNDGFYQFRVDVDISAHALLEIILYGNRQIAVGRDLGRKELKGQLLGLIGAQRATGE